MIARVLMTVMMLVALSARAPAEKPLRDILSYAPDKTIPAPAYLTPIVLPTASSLVVNEAQGTLWATHRPPKPKELVKANTPWPQLTFAKLDENGLPAPGTFHSSVTLPKPPALASHATYPLALLFHPKLPLLYVWQDIEPVTPRTEAADALVHKEFDHILVFHIDGPQPEFLMSFGRGPRFAYGQPFAAMTFDPGVTRLFVGNILHVAPKDTINGAVGYFRLAADGLPDFDPEPRMAAADRAGRIAVAKALAAKTPPEGGLKRISTEKYGLMGSLPCGLGLFAPTADILVIGGGSGPIVWEMENRRAELQACYVPPFYRPGNLGFLDRMAAHPSLPALYGVTTATENATWTDSYLYRIEHADGFPTLLPQRIIIYYFLASTPPVFVTKHRCIAVGGRKRIAFFALDDQGRLTKDRNETEVPAARVQGLAYSARFDKLYVAADEPPPPPKDPKK